MNLQPRSPGSSCTRAGSILRRVSTLVLLSSAIAAAQQVPDAPFLRIETRTHIGAVQAIDGDASGRWIATAANDKTARVWDRVSGRPIATLRPPIADGDEGRLLAVAMSPDGSRTVVGGKLHGRRATEFALYVFESATGRVERMLDSLPSTPLSLRYSADGQWLAVTMAEGGLRVYRGDTFDIAGTDSACARYSHRAVFSQGGALATTCGDGRVRLFRISTAGLQRLAERNLQLTRGSALPCGLAFSPDGAHLAVSYCDRPVIDVLDAQGLQTSTSLSIGFAAVGQPGSVAEAGLGSLLWQDDDSIVAAGSYIENGRAPVLIWSGPRGVLPQKRFVANSTVMDMVALPSGEIGFGASNGEWGVLHQDGSVKPKGDPKNFNFPSANTAFGVMPDASGLSFADTGIGTRERHRFLLEDRSYSQDYMSSVGVTMMFETASDGLGLQGWRTGKPTLNGVPIRLRDEETSTSATVDVPGRRLVIGTNTRVLGFSAAGALIWERAAPGGARAVSFPLSWEGPELKGTSRMTDRFPARKLLVVAYGDGSIRWHRAVDGQELLAFFPHADHRRWVLWTPSGYFDASPGADDLVVWHVNRGIGQASDVFPLSKSEQLYRPDIIDRVLRDLDEAAAAKGANTNRRGGTVVARLSEILPPVVEVLTPRDSDDIAGSAARVKIRVRTSTDAPATALRVRVNNQLVALGADAQLVGNIEPQLDRDILVPIPGGPAQIQVFATNKNGWSLPATVQVVSGSFRTAAVGKPKLYVLAVGISGYSDPSYRLRYAAKDATDFVRVMQLQSGQLYDSVEVRLLRDSEASRDAVLDGVRWLVRSVTPRDVGFVFFAGHGFQESDSYYFASADFRRDDLLRSAVRWADVTNLLGGSFGARIVAFLDTCYAGAASQERGGEANLDVSRARSQLAAAETGVYVFSSSTARQASKEDPALENGYFTKVLVDGLSGRAASRGSGIITNKALDEYVSREVRRLTGDTQVPVTAMPPGAPEFPIALAAASAVR